MSKGFSPLSVLLLMMPATLSLAAATAEAPRTVGDLRARDIAVHPETPVPGTATKAMQNYQRFLQLQNTDPALRAQALRRLGDLSLESGELERLSNEVTQLDMQGAEAIRLYGTLLKAYPDYPRNDQVLYQLARAYETTGQPERALAMLNAIVQRFPNSRELGEVQFRRGELLFSARLYAEAQGAYRAVIARGKSGSAFYEQSLYKHGWSQFKQGMNQECLDSFASVLDQKLLDATHPGTVRSLETLSRADRELAEDTLRVMSISFSYLDGASSLDQLLARRGATPYAWLLYLRLGDLYVDKQRYQDAASTYRAFVARDPADAHSPTLSMQAIEAYRKGGFADLVVEGKTEYANSYGFGQPFWNGRQRDQYPQVVTELKTNLKDLAQHFHATAQKSRRPEDYSTAAHWYGERLRSFPDDPESSETNYMLAEVLFESRQYAAAATEYERSAYDYPPGARSATAAYAALVAYQKQEELLPAAERAAWHARATESGLKFADAFPEHPESAGVQTRAAQDLFAARDTTRAVQTAEKLLARVPPVEAARQRIAWTIIGQTKFDQGDFPLAENAFALALRQTSAAQPEYADVSERLAAAVYRQGEAKRQAGDEAGSANDFLRVAQLAPASKVVATAQYDAAAALVNSKQWVRAVAVLEAYRHDYPKSEYAADVTRKLAVAYVEIGQPALAAAEFERIAASPAEEAAVAREALARAADLYEKAGNSTRSVALLEQLVAKYPTPLADAIETRARLAEAARSSGNAERLRHWQGEIIKSDAAAGADRTDRTRFLAAGAKLALVTPARDAFRAVRLTAPLKQSLAAKKRALEIALKGYQEVAAYNVAATTTAANYEMAELYRVLARDLMASERPKKLSSDEREQYDALLEEQAFPLEEQAIKLHELNSARTVDGIYDEPVRQSFRALAELKPGRYGKVEQSFDGPGDGSVNIVKVKLAIMAQRAGKPAEAETTLRQVLEHDPANAVAWSELGIVLRQGGRFKEARDAYERSLAGDANYAPAHRNLAVLLDLYLNEPLAALPELQRYRELGGDDKPVNGWIAELRARTGVKATPAPEPAPVAAADAPAAEVVAPTERKP